jgi:hypothetical protein
VIEKVAPLRGFAPPHAGSGDQRATLVNPEAFYVLLIPPVNILMADCTQTDEVLCRIVSELAAEIQVMYLKIS